MPKRAIHFMGFLADVNDSVLKLKLGDGYEIESLSEQQARPFLSRMEFHYGVGTTTRGVLAFDTDGSSSKYCCIVGRDVEEFEGTAQGGVVSKVARLEAIRESVRMKCRLLRLFREGNVFLRLSCFYHDRADSNPGIFEIAREGPLADVTRFDLEDNEIGNAQSFLRNNRIPFAKPYIQLAFESFELSYETYERGLAFLALMIGLETLLNPSGSELRYRVSRNTGVLLGTNRKESERIFVQIRDFYDKRSRLVHTGERETITNEDVLALRSYVREAIKKMIAIGGERKLILDSLNIRGFGEQP